MKARTIIFSTGLALSTVLAVSSSAKAAIFTTTFTPTPADPKKDIFLQSITQDGVTFSNFNFVDSVNIVANTAITATSLGGASTDRGDQATNPGGLPPKANLVAGNAADGAAVAAYLGNNNLNNIIETEDPGAFVLDLRFTDVVRANAGGRDSLFFWERGSNSDLLVQGLDSNGNLIGSSFKITRNLWTPAGYRIDTTEITGAQDVGSYGVSLTNLGLTSTQTLSGIRLIAERGFIGPDFKVVAANASIPEPATVLGLGSVAALALVRCRGMKKSSTLKASC